MNEQEWYIFSENPEFLHSDNHISHPIEIFNRYAIEYDSKFGAETYKTALLHKFTEMLPDSLIQVLDMGCGPGNLSKFIHLNRPDSKFTLVDGSVEMIHVAQSKGLPGDFVHAPFSGKLHFEKRFNAIVCSFLANYLLKDELHELIALLSSTLMKQGLLYFSLYTKDNPEFMLHSNAKNEKIITYIPNENNVIDLLKEYNLAIQDSYKIISARIPELNETYYICRK
ncbi:MAG: methyltransferase domain-containing protein [Bacteroidia bacterium]